MTKKFQQQVKVFSFSIIAFSTIVGALYLSYNLFLNKKQLPYGAYLELGNKAFSQDNLEEALKQYKHALYLNPKSASAHYNLGLVFQKMGERTDDYTNALYHLKLAHNLNPESNQIILNFGCSSLNAGKLDEAIALFNKLLLRDPSSYAAHIGIGQALERKNNINEAIKYYKKAISIDPNIPNAHVALAGGYFFLGNYEDGFKEYEHRWNMTNIPEETKKLKWNGIAPKGKKIFLIGENGLGDIIQFIRFARQLKEQGAYVSVMVQEPLMNLFSQCDYIDEIVERRTRPHFDHYTLLQSLAHLLKTTEQTLPKPPYLKANQQLVDHWKEQLKDDHNVKVGICWMSGGDKGHVPQGKRSIALEKFARLANIKGVSFYSLHRGEGEEQLHQLPHNFTIRSFGQEFDVKHGGFMDTAALMMNLDLILTIDTSVAHLAGALAVPTWTLLPFTPDPRWMLNRTDTSWYPTMHLFRQSKPGNWNDVLEEVATKLTALVQEKQKNSS